VIMLPYLPSELLALPWDEALGLIQNAVDLAAERGAKVVGLGGFSSIIVEGGLALRAPPGVTVTNGNSFTSLSAMLAVEAACTARGLAMADCTAAVVGAGGVIGHALSLLCAERMGDLILIGNPRAGESSIGKLRSVAQDCERHVRSLVAAGRKLAPGGFGDRLIAGSSAAVAAASGLETVATVTTDINQYLPKAQIVFAATNAVLPFISSRHLAKGAVVCDVSRPFNVVSDLADERADLQVLHGGLIRAPGKSILGLLEEPDRSNEIVACAAETMVLALSGYSSSHLCGRLDIATVEAIGRLADGMGFSVAPASSAHPIRRPASPAASQSCETPA